MAFSRKGKRSLTVAGTRYFYSVTGNDGYIHLWVSSAVEGSPRLSAYFKYHQERVTVKESDGRESILLGNQFVITPYTVRQVIRYGLQSGWNPLEKGTDVHLRHLDDQIDLRLAVNREEAIKAKHQTAIGNRSDRTTEIDDG